MYRKETHPFTGLFYFCAVIVVCLLVKHPVVQGVFFLGALVFCLLKKNWNGIKTFFKLIPFFLVFSCFNPLVSHWGNTVIFYLFSDKSKPVTLESFCFGLNTAAVLLTVLLIFMAFSKILTGEKLHYIFSPVFPNLSIMIVMVFRLLPMFSLRWKEIAEGREALGLKNSSGFKGKIKNGKEILLAAIASTLEDGKITALSMEDRGWGKSKRTHYIKYRFTFGDFLISLASFSLLFLIVFSCIKGGGKIIFYPEINAGDFNLLWNRIIFFSSVVLSAMFPFFL